MGWPKIWKGNRSAPLRVTSPDGPLHDPSYDNVWAFSGQSPTNRPGPFIKTVDSVPQGENKSPFSITNGNLQPIFNNVESVQIEVCEIFFQTVGASVVQIFKNGTSLTGILTLSDKMGYSDSGFTLAQGETVQMTVSGGGTINGFVRWRYR